MIWSFPYALLLLSGAVPLILFLHSLKPRGVRIRTTTLFIWERVLQQQPLGTRLGWLLRKNLLLVLQLLAVSILIAALADPALLHFGAPSGDTIAVIDLSASMKARGGSMTRFEAARKKFLALVDELGSGNRMMVIGAGAEPRLLAAFTADKRKLRELARKLEATDAPGRVKDAILFAHAFLKQGSPDRVVVISDGAFEGAEDFTRSSAHLRFLRVEGGKDNIGIVGFEMRRQPNHSPRLEIMVHIKNFMNRTIRGPLSLMLAGKTLRREEIEIGANERRVLIYPYPFDEPLSGTLEARLEIDDDFPTDNRAYLAVNETPVVRVLYVGPGNPFLENLFRFFPHVELATAPRWEANSPGPKEPYDIVIFDRVSVPPLNQGNFILIDTVAPNFPIAVRETINRPRLVTPITKHAVTEGLLLGDLNIGEALKLAMTGEGVVLARSAETPLLVGLDRGKLRALIIGFDVTSSDLPFRVAFPILFHNAIEWLHPNQTEFPAQSVQAGSPYELRLPVIDSDLEVTAPSGRKEDITAVTRPTIFADTTEVGVYSFKTAHRQGRFAVNLFDEDESQIAPRIKTGAAAADKKGEQGSEAMKAEFSLWPALIVVVVILLVVEGALAFRSGATFYPLAARTLTCAALLVALIDPKILKPITALDVVLGVDLSRSVGEEGREKAREILETAGHLKNSQARTGLLLFGRAPAWEFLPRRDIAAADFSARLDREQTDIQAALEAALAQVDEGRQNKILLISDGNENRGETARVLPLLRAQNAQVWTLPVTLARGRNEIYLNDLIIPRQVDSAEGFEIRAAIESVRDAPAHIKLLRDGILVREQDLQVRAGTNRVSFRESLKERGNHQYELLLESKDDTLAENNVLQGVVEVKGPPKVLLLSTQKGSQRFLSRVLQVQGYSVVESSPETQTFSLPELSSFDLLILDNVPAFQLSQAKMETIEKYVRDLGGGLLVIGGSQSYGAGGYYRTPFERLLPVDMRPPARLDLPHVALLFVLDKSGSMGAGPEGSTKLDLAKAAAVAAADIMNPTDQVGILAFDAAWDWTLPFRQVGKGEWISDKLSSLQSDGGTDMYKAMAEAYRVIATKQAAIKHVLVLSDGLTDKADFDGLVTKMVRDGITVSTVSVGSDADVKLMADIARNGKGRGYVAIDPETIPQIFTAETLLIARDLLIEKPVTPKIMAPAGPLKGIAQSNLPSLRGYVLTYPKPRSELLMTADTDPLLVSWRYGLGRVTAFTSDLSGRWGKDWVTWRGFPQWASQLARDTMRKILTTKMRTEFKPEEDSIRVSADFVSAEGNFLNHLNLKANITAPNQSVQEKVFQQTAPGRYETKFSPSERGVHLLTLYAEGKGAEAPLQVGTVPYIAPYPKEYRELKPNIALLSRLAEETGGEMLDSQKIEEGVKRLYTPTPGKSIQAQETWWPLSGIGLLLFLADLVLRSWPRRAAADAMVASAAVS